MSPSIVTVVATRDCGSLCLTWPGGDRSLLDEAVILGRALRPSRLLITGRDAAVERRARDLGIEYLDAAADDVAFLAGTLSGHDVLARMDPMAPGASADDIRAALRLLEGPVGRVVAVSRVPGHWHPRKLLCMNDRGELRPLVPDAPVHRRQEMDGAPVYIETGAFEVVDLRAASGGAVRACPIAGDAVPILDESYLEAEAVRRRAGNDAATPYADEGGQ